MENNGIWIRIQFNDYNRLEDTEELVAGLKEICPVQVSTKWYPAACTGVEFFLALNFNLSLSAFVNNVIIPGAEFAAICKAATAVWKLFDKFLKKNESFDLQKLELTFDDITLVFHNVMSYGALLKFYKELPEHLRVLQQEKIENILTIKLPYIEEIDDETGETSFREWTLEDEDEEVIFWKVLYELGCEKCYYNPDKREVITLY